MTTTARWTLAVTLVLCTAPWLAADGDFGTIGIRFEQLYDDAQANKRGPLVALDVVEGLPGAKAGVHRGDIVFAIDGAPVMGGIWRRLIVRPFQGR
jgi:C-terminal processing protease CtpA/Prc